MDNPTSLYPIETKLQVSSNSNYTGAGIKMYKVNRTTFNDVQVCHGTSNLATAGCYITETTGTQYQINQMPVITNLTAKKFELYGNNAGVVGVFRVIGVSATNDEQEELVSVNGTTPVNTVLNYKCVNDVIQVSGNQMYSGRVCFCRPSGGTPYNILIQIGGDFKINPLFMASNKNGKRRRARLVAFDSSAFGTARTHLNLHVFQNNMTTTASLGLYNSRFRLYDAPITTAYNAVFSEESTIEILAGELAVWYKETTTTTSFANWHWELFYID